MRKGVTPLAAQAETVLKQDPFAGHLCVFRGRQGDLVKVIIWWVSHWKAIGPSDNGEAARAPVPEAAVKGSVRLALGQGGDPRGCTRRPQRHRQRRSRFRNPRRRRRIRAQSDAANNQRDPVQRHRWPWQRGRNHNRRKACTRKIRNQQLVRPHNPATARQMIALHPITPCHRPRWTTRPPLPKNDPTRHSRPATLARPQGRNLKPASPTPNGHNNGNQINPQMKCAIANRNGKTKTNKTKKNKPA